MINNIKGFLMNLEKAQEFFQRCIDAKAETREEKQLILAQMVKEFKAIEMDEKRLAQHLHGKKVLRIKGAK